jgi:tRNA(fMet)-specific endonuclease VapC
MTLRYLLDTNVISEPVRPQPDPNILKRLQQHQAEVAIATVVWHELVYGAALLPASARRTAIEHYLHQVIGLTIPLLPYDEGAATWHAQERARLVQAGRTPTFADGQIAAIAQTNQLILVSANTNDFADFSGLATEDWRS